MTVLAIKSSRGLEKEKRRAGLLWIQKTVATEDNKTREKNKFASLRAQKRL